MRGIEMQIGNLPLSLTCYENGQVQISRIANFPTIVDQPEQGVMGIFDSEGATIGTTDISYGEMLNLNELGQVKAWIAAQGLELPSFM